jgi:hypothetical protein
MTDTTPNHKLSALQLAIHVGGTPDEVVKRATVYHAYLSGAAQSAAGATPGPKTTATTGATPGPKGATPGPKGATTAAPGPKAGATTAAPGPKAGATTAAPGPKAAAAKAGPANAQAVSGDTKAPGGKNTYQDVVNALCKVREKITKDEALKVLAEDGGGVKSVRDLKPALYDAVVEGCDNALSAEGGAEASGGVEFDDPTASPPTDELGLPE